MSIYRDEVIRGTGGRDKRSGAGLLQTVVSRFPIGCPEPFGRIHVLVIGGCACTTYSESPSHTVVEDWLSTIILRSVPSNTGRGADHPDRMVGIG